MQCATAEITRGKKERKKEEERKKKPQDENMMASRSDVIFARLAYEPNQINSDFVGFSSCRRREENDVARSLTHEDRRVNIDSMHAMMTWAAVAELSIICKQVVAYCTPHTEKMLTEHSVYEMNCAAGPRLES